MNKQPSLDDLWESAPPDGPSFDPDRLASLPEPARRYLTHAIAPGTRLASAVRLKMHGDFRLNKKWIPFRAEQLIRWDGEMLWRATMHLYTLPITGFDSLLEGKGIMQWKLFGLVPLAAGEGPEITRSVIGRVEGETVWLPSLLLHQDVTWTAPDASHAHAVFSLRGEETELILTLAETGQVERIRYERWGDPEGGEFHYADFGGVVEEERAFGGYTVPTRMRAGWYFGTERFASEGEFFRVTIDDAAFR